MNLFAFLLCVIIFGVIGFFVDVASGYAPLWWVIMLDVAYKGSLALGHKSLAYACAVMPFP